LNPCFISLSSLYVVGISYGLRAGAAVMTTSPYFLKALPVLCDEPALMATLKYRFMTIYEQR
jgi:hypothetical protein